MELELELLWLPAFTNTFRSDVPCLTFHVITWFPLFYLEKLELFMLVHVRWHGIGAFSSS